MLLNGSKKRFVGPTTLVSIQLLPLLPILVMLANVSNALHCTKSFPLRIFFSKCDQIRSKLRIWSHLLKKSVMENFIFYAV